MKRFAASILTLLGATALMAQTPIAFSELEGVSVGNAQNDKAKTGVTVFRFSEPATAAVTVLGGGPASRETTLLGLDRNDHPLHALVFAGGSTFGLEAAEGVVACLEKNGIGYDTGYALIPLVCQSDIYDLGYGRSDIRPDKKMGYEACAKAMKSSDPRSGNVGAGTGATVGKPHGGLQAQKSGIGYAAARIGDLKIGVAAVVNAYGDIYYKGKKIAGMTTPDRSGLGDSAEALYGIDAENLFTGNTTLVAVFTNGSFSGAQLKKIANMAAAGMARGIKPVFTMADGDTIYALSVGSEKVDGSVNIAGALAAELIEEAFKDAIESSRIPDAEFLGNLVR